MLKSVIREYGISWVINRSLYSMKLKFLRKIPAFEKVFEKDVKVKRINIFDRIDSNELTAFLQSLSVEKQEEIIEKADNACLGRIKAFSSVDFDYGYPVDWQLNPLTGMSCDRNRKWYVIPDFDKDRGDIKNTWEISRFGHFLYLARAYLLTKNIKYYEAFANQVADWLDKNRYSYGANYKCGQECSIRMVNLLLAYAVFSSQNLIGDQIQRCVEQIVEDSYKKVLSNFFYAYKCIKNNHTVSELVGMIIGAWCTEDKKQLQKAYSILDEVICEQVYSDGGYRQYSFNYQRLFLQDIACILSVQAKTGLSLSVIATERINLCARLMYQCQDENGDMPNYGSNDGALIFPVNTCSYRDFRPVINTIYAMLNHNKPYPSSEIDEELIWWGYSGIETLKVINFERKSAKFPEAGLFTLRTRNAWIMTILNDYQSRPAHQDQLSIDLWINGVNVLCDTGTYSYASDLGKKLMTNEAHNTLFVTRKPQMNTKGPFLVYDWIKRDEFKASNDSFEGHMTSKNGYKHARKIKVSDGYYEIQDKCRYNDKDSSYLIFYTPCEVKKESGLCIFYDHGKELCKVKFSQDFTLETAERSLYYLKSEKINKIVVPVKNGVLHKMAIYY